MSRPCFALSVMLCCMGGPLLIIGNAHAHDTGVSPSHDPGECIVCPLAHGPLEPCGGYSDYDYNNYWYDDYSSPAAEPTPPADPALDVAQSPSDDATEEAWESEYEDYYADYVYGEEAASTASEDLTLDETPAPAALVDPAAEAVATPAEPQYDEYPQYEEYEECEEYSKCYDEYGWYADDMDETGDYFDSYDDYEPIESDEPDAASPSEATASEADIDYEAYEEEWFSYGAEDTVEAPELNAETDEAYEALSMSANEAPACERIDAQSAELPTSDEAWGDEEAWYFEEYGDDCESDEGVGEAVPAVDSAEQLETGYDDAYDAAMATDLEAAEAEADSVPANPSVESTEVDDYESFYDAYDDLYNFESTPAYSAEGAAALESETSGADSVIEEPVRQVEYAEPAWLTELVDRMLDRIWTTTEVTAMNASILNRDSSSALYVDECAQEWDCEADYWAQPEAEQTSVVLTAADTLDGMAAVLQDAAEFLRGVASGHLGEMAQAPNGEATR